MGLPTIWILVCFVFSCLLICGCVELLVCLFAVRCVSFVFVCCCFVWCFGLADLCIGLCLDA